MEIISRKEAQALGLKRYFTGKPCGKGHIAERYVSDTACLQCHRDKHAKRRQKNWKAKTCRDDLAAEKEARSLAEKTGAVHYATKVPCKRGHIGMRYTKSRNCVECAVQDNSERHFANRDENNRLRRERRVANIDAAKAADKAYRSRNKSEIQRKHTAIRRRKRESDPVYAMKHRIRSLVSSSISRMGYGKNTKTADVVGCSWAEFKAHIERQFLPGMTWENRHLWHIDHIVPMATAKTYEDVISLNHVSNLRPIWKSDNLEKSDKVLFLI